MPSITSALMSSFSFFSRVEGEASPGRLDLEVGDCVPVGGVPAAEGPPGWKSPKREVTCGA